MKRLTQKSSIRCRAVKKQPPEIRYGAFCFWPRDRRTSFWFFKIGFLIARPQPSRCWFGRPQNGTQAHDMSRELRFGDRLMSALPRFGTARTNTGAQGKFAFEPPSGGRKRDK